MALLIKVKKDLGKMEKRFSKSGTADINDKLGEQVTKDMSPFVPKGDTKRLSKGRWVRGRKVVLYPEKYARAQFRGMVGRPARRVYRYSTAGTSRRWDLRAKAKHSKKWAKQVAKYYES